MKGQRVIGTLKIPAIELELPVMEECTPENLKIAPCLYNGSLYDNNMVICDNGNYRYFGRIKEMTKGHLILFTDLENNQYIYEAECPELIDRYPKEVLLENSWNLTLLTSLEEHKSVAVRCIFR